MAGLDYAGLSAPFDGDAPTGVDLREDPDGVRLYREIKDARSVARSEDRSAEAYVVDAGDERDAIAKPSDRWGDVHRLAHEALSTRTKDIELFAWLAEATVRLHGFTALAQVVTALRKLIVESYGELHSIDDETPADKAIPLAGLNGAQDSEGTLIRPLRLSSLVPGQPYGRFSFWELTTARREGGLGAFGDALRDADGDETRQYRAAISTLDAEFEAIDAHLTLVCGPEAPSLRRVRDVLDDVARAYAELGVGTQAAPASEPEREAAADGESAGDAPPQRGSVAAGPRGIETRDQAFSVLLEIASFFRKTEPHSPIPQALETIVRRGRMNFADLVAELIPDEHQRREVLTRAGIGTAMDE